MHFALGVVQDVDRGASLLVGWHVREHIEEQLIINLDVADLDGDLGIETAANL